MANFKLNSVLVATESGGTVTVDSAVAGIPAAGVTGVLPVGVTGGSGLDTLGTVTSGNLSNTAIVYPVGHVLNTHFDRPTTAYVTHSTASWSATLWSSSYTFKHVNSSLVVLGHISWFRETGAQYWIYLRILRSGTTKMEIGSYGNTNDYGVHPTCNFSDSGTHAVDDVWTYDLQIKSTGTDTVGINQTPNTGYKSSFTFFEIAT